MDIKYKDPYTKARHEDCLDFESFDQTYNLNTSHAIIQVDGGRTKPGIETNYDKFESSNGFQNFPISFLETINEEIEKVADMSEINLTFVIVA